MIYLQLLLLVYFVLTGYWSIGQLVNIKLNSFQDNLSQPVILGFCIFIIIINFLFFLFSFNINLILLIIFIFFLFSILINIIINKIIFFKAFYQIFNISILPIFFFLFISLFYGEQFYVFRGNMWDWFGFVLSGNYFSSIDTNDFLNFKNNLTKNTIIEVNKLDSVLSPYHFTIKTWIDKIPTLALLLGLVIKINSLQPFLMAFFLKIFFLILGSISIFAFLEKILKPNKFWKVNFYTQTVICSFWIIYILEAEYIRFLSVLSIYLYLLASINLVFSMYSKNNLSVAITHIFSFAALLVLYPEIFFIYFPILLITFLLRKNLLLFIKKNYSKIIISGIFIFILIYPTFQITLEFIYNQVRSTQFENRWWTYFGAFVFGSNSPALDIEFANHVKVLIQNHARDLGSGIYHDNLSLKSIINIIHESLIRFNFQNVYFNVIPSIFGYYFITSFAWMNSLILVFFSIFLIFIVSKNVIFIYKTNNSNFLLFKSSFIFLIIFGFILILQGKLWSLIKLYIYFFPFFYCVVLFNLSKLQPIRMLVLLMLVFPIYKFHTFNYGIGTFDSFPSIQKQTMKKEIIWNFDFDKYANCKNINLKFSKWDYYNPSTIPDHFKSMYLTTYLINNNFKFNDYKQLMSNNSQNTKICDVKNF